MWVRVWFVESETGMDSESESFVLNPIKALKLKIKLRYNLFLLAKKGSTEKVLSGYDIKEFYENLIIKVFFFTFFTSVLFLGRISFAPEKQDFTMWLWNVFKINK